jgi:hypothetical protein
MVYKMWRFIRQDSPVYYIGGHISKIITTFVAENRYLPTRHGRCAAGLNE